jgi:hypothetical protein
VLNPRVARVSPTGVVAALADGSTTVRVSAGGATALVSVTVSGTTRPARASFTRDVVPLLSRYGCNASGCHGKAEGQNGFKLSVFGFDLRADYNALTRESRGRRIFPASPEASLLLRKMSGQAPHGGGARIRAGTAAYQTIRNWVAAGAPFGSPDEPRVTTVRVEPQERVLAFRGEQQLRVLARYSDGQEIDVTGLARFLSNHEGLAGVDADGLVHAGTIPGEAAIMASFLNVMATFRAVVPRPGRLDAPAPPANNFVDRLVFARLRKLNIAPSALADDATYLRRVYLDLIGTLPTPAEARRFLADRRADKRARLVDELLKRSEFADLWAQKWGDLLRVERSVLGAKQARAYHKWIRDSVARNVPFDSFARQLITAEGPLGEVPAGAFYKVVRKPGEAASTLAQVFLGVRIACAECHHHPFDRWGQDDYHALRAYFTGVSVRGGPDGEAVAAAGPAMARHPRTGTMMLARPLGGKAPARPASGDRRGELADWLTSPSNPWFARNLANRVWAHLLGVGIVEPVDDVRATNPPSNPELLDALAKHLVASKFDVRALIRTITASRAYQLSSKPNATNSADGRNFSRALFKRLPAEVLLDMVTQTTGVPERFRGAPLGTRAIQLWDNKVPHYFLKTFGRPERASACACERNPEPAVGQVLHLMNAPEIQAKLAHAGGRAAKLAKRCREDGKLVEELYLTFYSRMPDARERKVALAHLAENKGKRRQAVEDLAWTLLNSLEFVFNH